MRVIIYTCKRRVLSSRRGGEPRWWQPRRSLMRIERPRSGRCCRNNLRRTLPDRGRTEFSHLTTCPPSTASPLIIGTEPGICSGAVH